MPTPKAGLTREGARTLLARYGPNRMVARDRTRRLRELLRLAADPMALMLLGAAGLYLAIGEVRDAIVMLVALVPVVGVDVFLEARSHAALRRLAERVAPRARVIRDGQETDVPTDELVPGDLLVLAEGDVLRADGVVRVAANLAIDESMLTGEAEPQAKQADPLSVNAAASFYAGSRIISGGGVGELTATGSRTRYGEIAQLVAEPGSSLTPLQRRTAHLVRRLVIGAAAVSVAVMLLALARGQGWVPALLGGISLAMSAMPEEFPLVFTLFLSVGAWRLSRRGVLVRRVAAVETLGSTTIICTDKTGTITRGSFDLEVTVVLADNLSVNELLEAAVLACELQPNDSMDRTIVDQARGIGVDAEALHAGWSLVRDYDFDVNGKHMSHVWERRASSGGAHRRIVAKGALEGVLEHCSMTDAARTAAQARNAELASHALRVLAVAGRDGGAELGSERVRDEDGLTLYGLLGFGDPVRPAARAAIAECQAAGVRLKLITGDHALTAYAVAHAVGIADDAAAVVTGAELDALPEPERNTRIVQASVFARISPAQKYAVIEVLRASGEVVAMTGDGINDAPALRRADIGVSMGARATEVARAAADLVLLDDDLGALVAAVAEGRRIFRDLQRAFLYLIAFHIPIVGLALLPPLIGVPLLMAPVHLVWLELVVHPISAFAFQGSEDIGTLMRQPPRAPTAPLLPSRSVARAIISGVAVTVISGLLYLAALPRGQEHARSLALAALLISVQLLVLAEYRASVPSGRWWPRSIRFWSVWSAATATLPLALMWPSLASVLHMTTLTAREWVGALLAALLATGWRFAVRR